MAYIGAFVAAAVILVVILGPEGCSLIDSHNRYSLIDLF
jgi:hypothetical protein